MASKTSLWDRRLLWLRKIRVAALVVLFLPCRWAGQWCYTGRQPPGGLPHKEMPQLPGNSASAKAPQCNSIAHNQSWASFSCAYFCNNHVLPAILFSSMLIAGMSGLHWHQERAVSHILTWVLVSLSEWDRMVCAVLDIFDFIIDKSTAGRVHQLPKSLLIIYEQQMKLLCTFLRKRGYKRGKDSCFLWGPQTAKFCILPAAPYAQRRWYLAKHVSVFKGTHERFSPDSSRISLSGTIIDSTQIIQSFNSLCQTTITSQLILFHRKTHQVFWCAQKKRASLALTLHQLLPPIFTLQHTGKHTVLQLLITSPAPPASPGNCTQHPAAAVGPGHQHPLSNPLLRNSALHRVNLLGEGSRQHQQSRGFGSLKAYRRQSQHTEKVCTAKALALPAAEDESSSIPHPDWKELYC